MKKTRILIIDNEKSITHLAKLALPQYEIREENDPTHALKTAREFLPDLILLDVMMPVMDGGDVAAEFKAHRTFDRVPIIFLTGIITPDEGRTNQMIGGYPFIAKPFHCRDLVRSIEDHLKTA